MSDSTATVVTNTCVMPGHENEFAAWQQQMSGLAGSFPGFLGQEVIPPYPPTQVDWVIVQRFSGTDVLRNWLESTQRADMLAKIRPVLLGEDSVNVFVGGEADEPTKETTAVIMTKVAPGAEHDFEAWHARLAEAQAAFPGHLRCDMHPPVPGFQDCWVTMLTFDTPEHLNAWLGSAERQAFIKESERFVEKSMIRQARSGFSNWFAFGAQREGMAPAWKNNYIVLLGLYPIVMLEIMFLNPFFYWLPTSVGNFIGNIISVGVLGWPVIWLLSKWFSWWLTPAEPRNRSRDLSGAILVLVLVAIMGVAFYFLGKAVTITPVTSI